jgi:hypothetical protein
VIKWQDLAAEFEPDGSLRDIYVHHVNLSDWQTAINAIRDEAISFSFLTGGQPAVFPNRVSSLFNIGPDDMLSCLHIGFGSGTLNCHFFSKDEIEFDLDPRDMNAQMLPKLIQFMTLVGRALGKPVSLTHENNPEAEFMRFEPTSDRVEYVGPAFPT